MKNAFSAEKILLVLLLIIASVMRFYNYSGWSLSNDELSALARLRYADFTTMIEQGVKLNDMHPPGVQTFLYYYSHLFGTSEAAVRLPFVLMGILSVYIFFLIGKRWFNQNTALLATTAFCFLQFPILYSQLARPYSPGLFFSLLTVFFWTRVLQEDETVNLPAKKYYFKDYSGYILASVGCMYSHYFSFMFAGIVGLCGLFLINRTQLKWYLLSGLVMFFLYLPSAKIFIYHFSIGGLGGEGGWLGAPETDAIFKYIQYCFNDNSILSSMFVAILALSILTKKGRIPFSKFQTLCLVFFFAPALIAYFYSIYKNPVFQYSILLFSFPYLLLFIFSFLPEFKWKPLTLFAWLCLAVFGIYSTVVKEKFYSTQHFGVFKDLVEKTIEYDNKYEKENITHTINVINPYYSDYYSKKLNQESKFVQYSSSQPKEIIQLDSIVQHSPSKYFLHAWSNTYDPPEAEQIIARKYPVMIEKINYFNSGITLFADESMKSAGKMIKPLFEMKHDFEKLRWNNDSMFRTTTKVHSGNFAAHLDKEHEFSPTFQSTLSDINFKKGCVIDVSVWINATKIPLDANLVLSIDDKEKNLLWRGVNTKDILKQADSWQQVFLSCVLKDDFNGNEIVKAYVWNSGKADFYMDDLEMKVRP